MMVLFADDDFEYWRRKRTRTEVSAEVCVVDSVRDIIDHVVRAYVRHPGGAVEDLFINPSTNSVEP